VAYVPVAGAATVTLQWPPAAADEAAADPQPQAPGLMVPVRGGLSDPRLIAGIAEINAMIAAQLDDHATAAEVMPVIRDATRRWLEQHVRSGQLPASAGSQLDELAAAVHDRRYGLGPLSVYLRDPQVENVDINGYDQVWISYATGERVAGPPVAASDDALIAMVRTWATRGGQTARDFSAAAPLVNVTLSGSARLTATMSVTPRPCVSLRLHGQLDITLARLTQLGTVDTTLAAFLAAAVKSRCNIIITGGVDCGKTTLRLEQP
jgi:Flp pilus assembly CpaF family ATPase